MIQGFKVWTTIIVNNVVHIQGGYKQLLYHIIIVISVEGVLKENEGIKRALAQE